MRKKIDINKIYITLQKEFEKHRMPVVDLIQFQTKDPFKVLVTTILSARTKDETTVKSAQKLFGKISTIDELEKLSVEEIEQLIYPVGFFRNKAIALKKLPYVLKKEFNGKIPQTVEELVKLPGVGRKTANLVVAVAFNKPAVCVDVHVHRIFNRLGYVKTKNPLETEIALRKKLPKEYWTTFNSYFVSFGQHLCKPINPMCNMCPIIQWCNQIGVKK